VFVPGSLPGMEAFYFKIENKRDILISGVASNSQLGYPPSAGGHWRLEGEAAGDMEASALGDFCNF